MSFSNIVTRLAEKAAQGIYYSTTRLPEQNDEETTTAGTPNDAQNHLITNGRLQTPRTITEPNRFVDGTEAGRVQNLQNL